MSKSEQKRICVQSKCAVRDELREQLDLAKTKVANQDKDIQVLAEKLNEAANTIKLVEDGFENANGGSSANKYRDLAKQYLKEE